MTTNTAQIADPAVFIKPSQKLKAYLNELKVCENMTLGIKRFIFKNPVVKASEKSKQIDYLVTTEDRNFLKSISIVSKDCFFTKLPFPTTSINSNDKLLSLPDLHWLYNHLQEENNKVDNKIYIHELLEGSEIVLPKNKEVPRNPQLELRCLKLKAEQDNLIYHQMTKNVDNIRKRYPEDTISYQLKQLNKYLVAIFQFILSVAAGFAFGFIGVELLIGSLDFGFRLLLGIICALTIALAELYFLAKKLSEDLQFEYHVEQQQKKAKLD